MLKLCPSFASILKIHAKISFAHKLQSALQTIQNLESVKGCRENLKTYKLAMKAPKPTQKFLVHASYNALSKQEEASLDSGIVLRFAIAS